MINLPVNKPAKDQSLIFSITSNKLRRAKYLLFSRQKHKNYELQCSLVKKKRYDVIAMRTKSMANTTV